MPSAQDNFRVLDDKPYESFYLTVDTIIDAPVGSVWPHALDIGSWMSDHRLETIAGEPQRVGHFERVHPRNLAAGVAEPHYHLYGIAEIIPLQLIVLEVFNENGGSYGKTRPKMAFDHIFLVDLDGKTKVIYHKVDVYLGKGDRDFPPRRKQELAAVREMLKRYFENLRKLARA